MLKLWLIGNRTSCRPIRSVIILAIKQIGLPLHGRPILLITRMITDRTGLHSVLLPLLIRKLNIYIETKLFYCSFRVTENISKFLSCFQRLPPSKRLNSSFFLFFGTVLEYEVILFSCLSPSFLSFSFFDKSQISSTFYTLITLPHLII